MPSENLAPSPHLECFADDVYVEWTRYNSELSIFVNTLKDLLLVILEIEAIVEKLRQILVHKHTRHYHPDLHEVDVFGNGYAPMYHYKADPPHTCFAREKDCSEDLDSNNKICGYDFLIADGPVVHRMMRYDTYLDIPNDIEWLFFDQVVKNELNDYHPNGRPPVDARAIISTLNSNGTYQYQDLTGTIDGEEILMILAGFTIENVDNLINHPIYIDNVEHSIITGGTGGAGIRWDTTELRKDTEVTEGTDITFVGGIGYYTTGGTGNIGVGDIDNTPNDNIVFIDGVGYYKDDTSDTILPITDIPTGGTGSTGGISISIASLLESTEFPSPTIPIISVVSSDSSSYTPGTLNYSSNMTSSGGDSGLLETNIPYEKDVSDLKIAMDLVKEIALKEDRDANGLIYNIDFYIPDDDEDKPKLISTIEQTSNLVPSKKAKEVSMQHFLSTLGLGKYKQDITDVKNPPGKILSRMIMDLIEEVLTGEDVDDDGLVYGRDFIILGDDTPAPLMSKYPILMPDIMMTWDAYLAYGIDKFDGRLTGTDYLNLLRQEYDNKTDLDGDGLIYGYDFRFNPDHPGNPENTFDILPQTNVTGDYKSWKNYISGLPTVPMEVNGYMMEELSVKLSSEQHLGKDVDGNGLIYGQHFIISDYDIYKSDCLWRLETTLNLVKDPEVYNYFSTNYLPRGIKEEYTIEEWNEYWGLTGGTGGTGGSGGDDDYKDSLSINQCISIERKRMYNESLNTSSIIKKDFIHKFVLLTTWADLLITNGEIDIYEG